VSVKVTMYTIHWYTTELVFYMVLKLVYKKIMQYVTSPMDNTKRSFESSITT